MGKFFTLLKWGTKLGIVGGACYLSVEEGFWGPSKDGEKNYFRLQKEWRENEYVKMIPAIELPEEVKSYIPQFNTRWNNGVLYAFDGLSNLPATTGGYIVQGKDALVEMMNASSSEAAPASEEKSGEKAEKSEKEEAK